jgi:hypothetical protein
VIVEDTNHRPFYPAFNFGQIAQTPFEPALADIDASETES